jgi:hypothetical protein
MAIWYILWPFDIFCGYFGIFFPFWFVIPRKIWQPKKNLATLTSSDGSRIESKFSSPKRSPPQNDCIT